jgi:signal transduction histidine kinase
MLTAAVEGGRPGECPVTLFDTSGLTPHGFCLAWDPSLLTLQVVSDAIIAVAYYSIPFALAYVVIKRRDLVFRSVFWLFAIFIMACGATHVMAIVTLWYPVYWTDGLVKAVTAVASIGTALILWPLIPKVLAIPAPAQLRDANERLAEQLAQRDALLSALRRETEERQRAEAMLRQSQKMEALGQVTGGVAHDFNNLLTVVQGSLDLLRPRAAADPRSIALIDRGLQAVERGAGLTHQLLAFGRRQPLEPTRIDPVALVERSLPLLQGTLIDGAVLEVDAPPGICDIEADANQLENVLLNLVINARDAMPARGGVITLSLADEKIGEDNREGLEAGAYVAIAVSDNGTGMEPDVAAVAFEPFFTTKPVGKGTGLGLSQVYGFTRQSRGTVRLQTAVGRGTRVTILLPCATDASAETDEPDQAPGSEAIATRA